MRYITVTLAHPEMVEDVYNNLVPDWTDPTETEIDRCLFEPTRSAEARDGGQSVRAEGNLYIHGTGTSVSHIDQIIIDEVVWDVAAAPEVWGDVGIVVPLVRVVGTDEGTGS